MRSQVNCRPLPAEGEGASPSKPRPRTRSARPAVPVSPALALLVLLSALLSACASAKYDAADFPRASSASSGIEVTWKATLRDITLGAPNDLRSTVHFEVPERWTITVLVTQSKPQIPPFVTGRDVTIGIAAPVAFFGTNDVHRGSTVEKTFVIWRAEDGTLRAASK